jgi:hypothetical protein
MAAAIDLGCFANFDRLGSLNPVKFRYGAIAGLFLPELAGKSPYQALMALMRPATPTRVKARRIL